MASSSEDIIMARGRAACRQTWWSRRSWGFSHLDPQATGSGLRHWASIEHIWDRKARPPQWHTSSKAIPMPAKSLPNSATPCEHMGASYNQTSRSKLSHKYGWLNKTQTVTAPTATWSWKGKLSQGPTTDEEATGNEILMREGELSFQWAPNCFFKYQVVIPEIKYIENSTKWTQWLYLHIYAYMYIYIIQIIIMKSWIWQRVGCEREHGVFGEMKQKREMNNYN